MFVRYCGINQQNILYTLGFVSLWTVVTLPGQFVD